MISELQVSRTLGVSRSPVREAIAQLVADGLVEQAPNRSSIVVELSRTDIIDLYEVREALETFAVRKAAERGVRAYGLEQLNDLLVQLQGMIDMMKSTGQKILTEEQQTQFTQLDLKLHALLVLSTQNTRMQKVVSETRLLVQVFSMRRRGHEIVALERIQEQHKAIVQAVADGDRETAAKLISRHIQQSLQERLDDFDLWTREKAMDLALAESSAKAVSA